MKLVLIGMVVGGSLAYGIKRLMASQYFDQKTWQRKMASQLYDVNAADPAILISITVVLIAIALVACWLPARRAARVDPLTALRHD